MYADRIIQCNRFTLSNEHMQLDMDGVLGLGSRQPFGKDMAASVNLHRLDVAAPFAQKILEWLTSLSYMDPSLAETLARLGDAGIQGNAAYRQQMLTANVQAQTSLGQMALEGSLTHEDAFTVKVNTEDFRLSNLLTDNGSFPVNHVSLKADAQGRIAQKTVSSTVELEGLHVKDELLDKVKATLQISPRELKATAQVEDPQYRFTLDADLQSSADMTFDASMLEQLQGHVLLRDANVQTAEHTYHLNKLRLASLINQSGRHLDLNGDFIDARVDGRFNYATLFSSAQQMLHKALPSLIPSPENPVDNSGSFHFSLQLWDVDSLLHLMESELRIPEQVYLQGFISADQNRMELNADVPRLYYDTEELHALSVIFREQADSVHAFLTMQRVMDEGLVDFTLDAGAVRDCLTTLLAWDDHQQPAMRGELSALTSFITDSNHQLGANISLLPTQIVIADTTWNVHKATVSLHDETVDVRGFRITQLGRHLQVDGTISRNVSDTLWADLRGINLQYVFGLIDFDDVDFAGAATGRMAAYNLMEQPVVDATLAVGDFTLNGGLLGELHVTGGWGRVGPKTIDLDAYITEPVHRQLSHVTAQITPGHQPGGGMELDVQARNLNAYFINSFTESFMTDLKGCVSGHAHLYGPFKQLDLEGDLAIDTLAVTIDVLGSRYHVAKGDSVHLRPGSIQFRDITILDRYHGLDNRPHMATLNGDVFFEHFQNIRYTFDITANDILGYDFHEFGDQTFYGTVFADGRVRLTGQSGLLNVDLQMTPTPGTVFTYNASSPETITDNQFITFLDSSPSFPKGTELSSLTDATSWSDKSNPTTSLVSAEGEPESESSEDEPTDMYLNFDLNITPDAQMRILMDPRSEDYITLFGSGHMRANYYNKGRFQMYGTYRVNHGNYRLSLQDIIRKEFQFERDGTIVFGGTPMNAALNLRAIYTVPGVSLNDLAVGNNFSASSVRVNCLMNIGGQAGEPRVSFDFDIPNVNEDEKQMVRALISTEEERNLQVIYLLGIGRFYTYGLSDNQNQTNTAMQSLLSSTLSGQLNNLLTSAIGNGNWNFGTNFSTGQLGWQDMDVEGSLSGRLLNNRLLINGTFGYRDTPVANTNFIGDFDVQWLLNKSGNVSLKAYSETNDRYFTKTALTTQGIGIQLRKDFNTLGELFHRKGSSMGR